MTATAIAAPSSPGGPDGNVKDTKLGDFVQRAVGDVGAAISGLMVHLGDRLGLYRAMAGAGPLTSLELAERTGTVERYVREWLANQAAGGYVVYNPKGRTFELPPEQATVLADSKSLVFVGGAYAAIASSYTDHLLLEQAFRSGEGSGLRVPDGHPHPGHRRFRPGHDARLIRDWIPALSCLDERLRGGASVVDVGCGHGASTILMAQTYPRSSFVGYDADEDSINQARLAAAEAGVGRRAKFEAAPAHEFPGTGYDLACLFDCLHDLADPVGAARRIRQALAADGTLLLVEPAASDYLEDNLTPVGRIYYGLSTAICLPSSLSQDGGLGLGAQAGELNLGIVLREAGFKHVRRVAETAFNVVLEATP